MNAEQLTILITRDIETLNEQPIEGFSLDTLSRIAVRLASLKAGLGRYSTLAKEATWKAEKILQMAKAKEYKRLRDSGSNATDAKELKLLGVEREYTAYIEAQKLQDQITNLSYNVHDLIDSIKSRLISQQMERRESES